MHIYKELSFVGDKPGFDEFKRNAPSFARGDWKYAQPNRIMNDYIAFDYLGDRVDQAEVSIYYGKEIIKKATTKTKILFRNSFFAIYILYNIYLLMSMSYLD